MAAITHNDVLRSVRYMLNVRDDALAAIFRLGGAEVTSADVSAWLKEEDEAGHRPCTDRAMASFLDGLIIHKRGAREGGPSAPRARDEHEPPTNNVVLKRLRIAFQLTDDDMIALMIAAGFPVSKSELSALFRNPSHPNYRACGDQFLRNFLKGLTARVRPAPKGATTD